jgi:hypothetical protein
LLNALFEGGKGFEAEGFFSYIPCLADIEPAKLWKVISMVSIAGIGQFFVQQARWRKCVAAA